MKINKIIALLIAFTSLLGCSGEGVDYDHVTPSIPLHQGIYAMAGKDCEAFDEDNIESYGMPFSEIDFPMFSVDHDLQDGVSGYSFQMLLGPNYTFINPVVIDGDLIFDFKKSNGKYTGESRLHLTPKIVNNQPVLIVNEFVLKVIDGDGNSVVDVDFVGAVKKSFSDLGKQVEEVCLINVDRNPSKVAGRLIK